MNGGKKSRAAKIPIGERINGARQLAAAPPRLANRLADPPRRSTTLHDAPLVPVTSETTRGIAFRPLFPGLGRLRRFPGVFRRVALVPTRPRRRLAEQCPFTRGKGETRGRHEQGLAMHKATFAGFFSLLPGSAAVRARVAVLAECRYRF